MRIVDYQPKAIYADVPDLDRAQYLHGLELFLDRMRSKLDCRMAFYQFGEVRTPGVSDIDLLIVVDDPCWRAAQEAAAQLVQSSARLAILFLHEPLVVGESLVPIIPTLHTLANIRFVAGDWQPLEAAGEGGLPPQARLTRFAVWNSFVRVAALKLDNKEIGLRQALILMHNLLATAENGLQIAASGEKLPLSTLQIRKEILSADGRKQRLLVRTYLQKILACLAEVELSIAGFLDLPPVSRGELRGAILYNRKTYLVPDALEIPSSNGIFSRRILKNANVLRMPAYLFFVYGLLAAEMGGVLPKTAAVLPAAIRDRLGVGQYAQHYKLARQLHIRHGAAFGFVSPFSLQHRNRTPVNFVKHHVQKWVLASR